MSEVKAEERFVERIEAPAGKTVATPLPERPSGSQTAAPGEGPSTTAGSSEADEGASTGTVVAGVGNRSDSREESDSLRFHPVAEIFPPLDAAALDALAADIRAHGLREPIWLHPNGEIIDGRHRYLACQQAGVEPTYRTWAAEGSLVDFVVSANLHRRHLSTSQRALVAAKIATASQGERTDLPSSEGRLSQAEAARLLGVGVASVERAATVVRTGTSDLVGAVERGYVSIAGAADIAKLPRAMQLEIVAGADRGVVREAYRKERAWTGARRREERLEKWRDASAPALGHDGKRYAIIYADPAWRYQHAVTVTQEVETHYPTMSHEELCALPVAELALADCLLYLWFTAPKIGEAVHLVEAWGFDIRSFGVWHTTDDHGREPLGMGYWHRVAHEGFIIAVRGNPPPPAPGDRASSVIRAPRGKHSEKPVAVYERIEAAYPGLPKIELFARTRHERWDSWGNEI